MPDFSLPEPMIVPCPGGAIEDVRGVLATVTDTRSMTGEMSLSEHTIQDHLKSITEIAIKKHLGDRWLARHTTKMKQHIADTLDEREP
jgi:hypothetical protein